MEVISAVDQKKEAFLNALAQACSHPLAAGTMLADAKGLVQSLPVPTTRTEEWKYTRVTRIMNMELRRNVSTVSPEKYFLPISDPNAARVVLMNGHFRADLSILPKAVNIQVQALEDARSAGLAEKLGSLSNQENEFFEALNLAYAESGVYIYVGKGSIIESPVYICHLTDGEQSAAISRCFIEVEERSSLKVIHHAASTAGCSGFHSQVTEAFVGKSAHLEVDRIQEESGEVFQHATDWVEQDRDSRFDIRTVTLKGRWVRNNLNVRVKGENCSTNMWGTYMPAGNEHIDNHTVVDHLVPHCESNEVYKGFLNDKSTGVFNGKVFVRQDAQKTNAFQQNANILLTNDATINSKPELEIYADDVKCSHGSTIGQLDEEAMFYLRTRGLSKKSARQLLVSAFVSEIMEAIGDDAIRDYCLNALQERSGNDSASK